MLISSKARFSHVSADRISHRAQIYCHEGVLTANYPFISIASFMMPFDGLAVLLIGDFEQLPPAGDTPLSSIASSQKFLTLFASAMSGGTLILLSIEGLRR